MSKIDPPAGWPDVDGIDTFERLLGGLPPTSPINRSIGNLTSRTKQLRAEKTDSAALAVASGASLVGFQQDGSGAVAQTVANKLRQIVSLYDFGAVGDGVADDTAAIQFAFTYAASTGANLIIPAAQFRLTAKITATGSFSVTGASRGRSILVWDNGLASSGLELTLAPYANLSGLIDVSRLHLITKSTSASGTALAVIGPASVNEDRYSARTVVRDVQCRGFVNPAQDGWRIGISFQNLTNSVADSVSVMGKVRSAGSPTVASARGIEYLGASQTPHHVGFTLTNSFITGPDNAVVCYDFEGVLISDCQIIAQITGVTFDGPNNFPHASIVNSHISSATTCISISRVYEVFVSNCLMYLQLSSATGQMILTSNGAKFISINNNMFENYNETHPANCIIIGDASRAMINGNIFRRSNSIDGTALGVGIWLTNTSSDCRVSQDNMFDETNTPILNQGTGNIVPP